MSALAGRTALVTGASRGIGEACARALAAEGARVVLVARTTDALTTLAAELPHAPVALSADLAQEGAVATTVLAAREALGADPDIVVHAAGTFPLALIEGTADDELTQALTLNTVVPLQLARAVLPGMRARGAGHIVVIGSAADRYVFPANAAYAASKHGARAIAEALRAETRESGVRATLVSPAATDTAIWDPHQPDDAAHLPNRSEMLRPEDVADAVLWAVTRPAHVNVDELRLSRG